MGSVEASCISDYLTFIFESLSHHKICINYFAVQPFPELYFNIKSSTFIQNQYKKCPHKDHPRDSYITPRIPPYAEGSGSMAEEGEQSLLHMTEPLLSWTHSSSCGCLWSPVVKSANMGGALTRLHHWLRSCGLLMAFKGGKARFSKRMWLPQEANPLHKCMGSTSCTGRVILKEEGHTKLRKWIERSEFWRS